MTVTIFGQETKVSELVMDALVAVGMIANIYIWSAYGFIQEMM